MTSLLSLCFLSPQTTNFSKLGGVPPSTYTLLRTIAAQEGWTKLYAGFGTIVLACPARALYFAGYEIMRSQGTRLLPSAYHPVVYGVAGPFAQLCGSLLWVPMDVVKERLQVQRGGAALDVNNPHRDAFKGSLDAFKTILRNEGWRAVYRGYWAHQGVWGPFNTVYFMTYEVLKTRWTDTLKRRSSSHLHASPIVSSFAADGTPILTKDDERIVLPFYAFPLMGAVAGCAAAAATAPLDTIKTRIQTQRTQLYSGILDCVKQVYAQEGSRAFFRGMGARCLWLSPNVAITMTLYEIIKDFVLPSK